MNTKKYYFIIVALLFVMIGIPSQSYAKKEDDECSKIKYALITSLRPVIDETIAKIYKDKPGGPRDWEGAEAEILNIKQLYGAGGSYRIKVKISTYVGAHNPPSGIDILTIQIDPNKSHVIKYKHIDN